jgi:hypothetical protein
MRCLVARLKTRRYRRFRGPQGANPAAPTGNSSLAGAQSDRTESGSDASSGKIGLSLHRSVDAGDALDDHAGLWTWPIPFAALAAVGFVRQRVLALRQLPAARAFASLPLTDGLAAFSTLDGSQRRVAAAERVPPLLFHAPLVLNWIALGIRYRSLTLPTCVNPTIPAGGMWGESKSNRLLAVADAQQKYVADFVVLKRRTGPATLTYDLDQACTLLATAGLHYPVVAKPDVGWHGFGVRLIADTAWLGGYLARFPAGAKLMLQRYVPYAGEAAVLYARRPGEANGRILSVTLRYFPHVVGDGQSTLRDLIRCDARARWKQRLHLGLDPMHHGPGDASLAGYRRPGRSCALP